MYKVKKVTLKDCEKVKTLFKEVESKLEDKRFISSTQDGEFEKLLSRAGNFAYGAYFDDRLVGFGAILNMDDYFLSPEMTILNIATKKVCMLVRYLVLPEFRKKGIASAIQKMLISKAVQLNYQYVIANAHPENIASIKVLEKDLQLKTTVNYYGKERCLFLLDLTIWWKFKRSFMDNLIIIFDKSLVIDENDYKIFKKENYKIDDGTYHIFSKEENCLFILDENKENILSILFENKIFENKNYYIIRQINYKLDKKLVASGDNEDTQNEVVFVIQQTLLLLNGILFKRIMEGKDEDDGQVHNYIIYDEKNHRYNKLISLEKRFEYMQFLPQLEYLFAIVD